MFLCSFPAINPPFSCVVTLWSSRFSSFHPSGKKKIKSRPKWNRITTKSWTTVHINSLFFIAPLYHLYHLSHLLPLPFHILQPPLHFPFLGLYWTLTVSIFLMRGNFSSNYCYIIPASTSDIQFLWHAWLRLLFILMTRGYASTALFCLALLWAAGILDEIRNNKRYFF